MKRLVLIDDDQLILKGLARTIAWHEHGFTVAATASDGEEGLAAIERERPQVVISDIRMPFMDGLKLTEAVKEKYPDMKIILLTSYDEFEYAQKALKLKVFDFVLKPVDNDKLLEVAKRAAAEWEREQDMSKKVLEGIPFLRQRFYDKLLRGQYRQEEIDGELSFLGLSLKGKHYTVILVIADDYFETGHRNRFGQELLKFCIHNLSQEVLDSFGESGIVFEYTEDEVAVIDCSAEEGPAAAERQAMQLAEIIRYNAETFLKTTVTVGVGSVQDALTGIAESYRQAKAATEFRHLTGTNQVLSYRDTLMKPRGEGTLTAVSGWESALALKIKLGLEREALDVIAKIERDIVSKRPMTLERLRLFSMEIILVMVNAFQDWSEPPYDKEALERLFQELPQLRTAKELFERIRNLAADISACVNERRGRQQQQLTDQAIAYIRDNYMREGLSLQDVADHVHISTNYLSMVFKKETGVNFSDFLTETRMKAAKELLRKEDLKTYQVAERVGYGNPQYFSVLFKKYTGKTPSEFKQSR